MTPDAGFFAAAAIGLAMGSGVAFAAWIVSIAARDVSIVDVAWGFLVLLPALTVAAIGASDGTRAFAVLGLAAAWALRLAAHIAWRHRGQPEDRRYGAMRRRNEPHFEWKSLYLVFGLQALLAWIVAAPLMACAWSRASWNALDATGLTVAVFGLAFEGVADAQLTRFKARAANRGRVMDRGLWRFSRHPNYFGECCLWWGFWLVAAAAGAWWTIVSPLLMTVLLVKVSGVPLLEKDLERRRPGYVEYVRRTPRFVPWRLRG